MIRTDFRRILVSVFVVAALAACAMAQYKQTTPRKPAEGELAVDKPGSYAQAGKTYVLTADVSGEMTPIFLGKDVTLDLNGHTVTFAAGKYEHVPNYGFEDGLKDWDVSKAPGAKVVSSAVRPMVGAKILELKAGDEIVSQYINLPVADRTYYAMCAVATDKMKVTINVDDEKGNPITCEFKGGKEKRVSPPEIARSPKLGGGVLFAHIHHMPAGKYRIRIKADTDALIDECDIRPGLDAGVGIVGGIAPYATYNDAIKWYPCAFFDYCKKDSAGVPVEGIPVIGKEAGTVTIKNGTIRNGTLGMRTLGVQSNAANVTVVLDNVHIANAGINTNSARLSKATLRNCRFEVDTPFIINRHDTTEMNVHCDSATEVAKCEFLGGQGSFSGACPDVHDNLFVNGQTVTNHYSIGPGSGTKIYRNRFEPKIGSGIYIGAGTGIEVYDNVFRIESAPPNCEYRYSGYSTNAIRISDYDTPPTPPEAGKPDKRCRENKVYHNKIFISGKSYPEFERYEPRAYAFFISVGGGTNYIYDNEITIDKKDNGNARAYAFFVGGSSNGGQIANNKVTSNCPAAWIGNDYGNAANTVFYGNTFTKAPGTPAGVRPFIMGDGGNSANDIQFFSNSFDGWTDLFEVHTTSLSYLLGWTLTVKVAGKDGKPAAGAEVVITDKDGKELPRQKTDAKGTVAVRLAQSAYKDGKKVECPSYTVKCGAAEAKVEMTKDQEVTLQEK
ncbi:MAG: hypothetical protein ACE15C_01010 [Phycisphaerae bacterium]